MTAQAQTNHFNLHTTGVGYLNRVRWVETRSAGRRAQPFLACSISALRGNADQPDYTYFDLKVTGQEAIEMVDRLAVDVQERRKVFISFRVGDIYAHAYEREVKDQNGRPTGRREAAPPIIKGRLLLINSITIDGENVFRRTDDAPADQAPTGEEMQEQVGQAVEHEAGEFEQDAPVPAPAPQRAMPPAPVARQPQSQEQGRSTAYQGGYAAGRVARQGAQLVADAVSR